MHKDNILFKWDQGNLIILLDEELDFEELLAELRARIVEVKNFFINSKIKIDVGKRELDVEEQETLIDIFKALPGLSVIEIIRESIAVKNKATLEARSFADSSALPTLLLNRTLRSGQTIEYNGNIVVKGDVNPGAEVKAQGDILVFGALRGLAHAGATGSEDATITAWRLNPTQLRISNKICRAPDNELELPNKPEIALVQKGTILIKDLKN